MRVKFLATVIIVALLAFLLGPQTGQSQPPRSGSGRGGFGGGFGGGGAVDPNRLFEMMARGGNTIKIADLRSEKAQEWAQQNGITNGEMTREQFADYMKTRMGGPRPASTTTGPLETAPKPGEPAAAPRETAGDGRWSPGGPGRGGRGGRDSDVSRFADMRFRQMDANQNGYLEFEEMSENLQAEKDKWDIDKDGQIDMDEFREYMKAWQEKRLAEREEGGRSGNSDGDRNSDDRRGTLPPGGAGDDPPPVDLDKKVAVLRAGKLGDKMPSWFTEHDTDKDAQVALWEWKEKNGELSEFRKWDLNGDGFITPDEVLRVSAVVSKESAPSSSSSSSGDSRTTSTGGPPRPGGAGAASTGNWLAQMFAGRRGGQGGGQGAVPPGGGFGRGFGGGMPGFGGGAGGNSADTMFERYARGRSSFNISEAGNLKASLTEYAEKKGLSDGMITKEQFRDYWAQRESERGSGSGGSGDRGGRSRGGRPR